MSWHGLKKAASRATTTIQQKTGMMEKTIDRSYEEEERRFRIYEAKMNKLHSEAKAYLDALRGMSMAQQRMAESVDAFYDDSAALAQCGVKYKEAMNKLDDTVRVEMDNNYRATLLEPLTRLVNVLPDVNKAIERRQKKLLDYDSLRAKVKALVDKPSEDTSKLPRAESASNQAGELFRLLNTQLTEDIPQLIDLRLAYLDPSYEALVKSQTQFTEDAYHELDSLRRYFPDGGVSGEMRVDGNVESVLQNMREMQIVNAVQ